MEVALATEFLPFAFLPFAFIFRLFAFCLSPPTLLNTTLQGDHMTKLKLVSTVKAAG